MITKKLPFYFTGECARSLKMAVECLILDTLQSPLALSSRDIDWSGYPTMMTTHKVQRGIWRPFSWHALSIREKSKHHTENWCGQSTMLCGTPQSTSHCGCHRCVHAHTMVETQMRTALTAAPKTGSVPSIVVALHKSTMPHSMFLWQLKKWWEG